jgi:hypothetical protein
LLGGGSGVKHQVLKQNLIEPPQGTLPGGVDSILVEQIVLNNSAHNTNGIGKGGMLVTTQAPNSITTGQNVLGGAAIAKLMPQN